MQTELLFSGRTFAAKSFPCTAAAVVAGFATVSYYHFYCCCNTPEQITSTYAQEKNKQQCTSTAPSANRLSSFYDDLLYIYTTVVQIRAQYVSQLKPVGPAGTFESWPSEKGVSTRRERRTIKHDLG